MKICNKCEINKNLEEYGSIKMKSGNYCVKSVCKKCEALKQKDWYRTKKGLVRKIYNNQKRLSKKRGMYEPSYTYEKLYKWITTQQNFEELYNNWINSDYHYSKVPSVDRLDNKDNYNFGNIQLITFKENNDKDKIMKAKKVVQLSKDLKYINTFESIRKAEFKLTDKYGNNIGLVLNNIERTVFGYIWVSYENYLKLYKDIKK